MNTYVQTALLWTSGGSLSGIPIGLALAMLTGTPGIGLLHWLELGMLVGFGAGLGAFFTLGLMLRRRPVAVIPERRR
jgi:hypothetical protein